MWIFPPGYPTWIRITFGISPSMQARLGRGDRDSWRQTLRYMDGHIRRYIEDESAG